MILKNTIENIEVIKEINFNYFCIVISLYFILLNISKINIFSN